MTNFFKKKVPTVLAYTLIIVSGCICLNWVKYVFDDFAYNETIIKEYDQDHVVSPFMMPR